MTPEQKQRAIEAADASKALICTAWSALANTCTQLGGLLALLPEGKERETVKALLAVYAPMAQRLDGLQPPGELNVYRAGSELPRAVQALQAAPTVSEAPPVPRPPPPARPAPVSFRAGED
jgi:hypothetical protein